MISHLMLNDIIADDVSSLEDSQSYKKQAILGPNRIKYCLFLVATPLAAPHKSCFHKTILWRVR